MHKKNHHKSVSPENTFNHTHHTHNNNHNHSNNHNHTNNHNNNHTHSNNIYSENDSVNSQKGSHNNEANDEFHEFVEAPALAQTQSHDDGNNGITANKSAHNKQTPQKDLSKMSFDELFKTPQLSSSASVGQANFTQSNGNNWGGYNQPIQGAQNNYGFNVTPQQYNHYSHIASSQQPFVNQFSHNPYIGYAPHNNLHAAYNLPQTNYNSNGFSFY